MPHKISISKMFYTGFKNYIMDSFVESKFMGDGNGKLTENNTSSLFVPFKFHVQLILSLDVDVQLKLFQGAKRHNVKHKGKKAKYIVELVLYKLF
jgi:hypothetical protein